MLHEDECPGSRDPKDCPQCEGPTCAMEQPKDFAKIAVHPKLGQILAFKCQETEIEYDEDGFEEDEIDVPTISIRVYPDECYGSGNFGFRTVEDRDKSFDELTAESLIEAADGMFAILIKDEEDE